MIASSVISPIIMAAGCVAFGIVGLAYRYLLVYVTKPYVSTDSRSYARALFQLFTGVYVLELCTLGLFLLAQDSRGAFACLPQALVMVAVILGTAVYHNKLDHYHTKLTSSVVLEPVYSQYTGVVANTTTKPWRHGPLASSFEDLETSASLSGPHHDICNPSLVAERPIVWMPHDPHGVSDNEIRETRATHNTGLVLVSHEGALLDSTGRVCVFR